MNHKFLNLLSRLSSRHYRRKAGLYLAEGIRCCSEAANSPSRDSIQYFICSESFAKSPDFIHLDSPSPIVLSDSEFALISETETPQGVLFVLKTPCPTTPTSLPAPFILLLDQVSDPGNTGTILRTAWAVGLSSVWITKGSCDPFSPKCIRSGMGAQFSISIHSFDSLEEAVSLAHSLGTSEVWCTLPSHGISIYDPAFKLQGATLIIGNEANGISSPHLGRPVTIPMPGHAESLNAAQAATVFLVDSIRPR